MMIMKKRSSDLSTVSKKRKAACVGAQTAIAGIWNGFGYGNHESDLFYHVPAEKTRSGLKMKTLNKILIAGTLAIATICGAGFSFPQTKTEAASVCIIPGKSACMIPGVKQEELKAVKTFTITERLITGILPDVEPEEEAPAYSAEDLEMLACAIYCEAGGDACTDETRRMVGEVILNRVADPRFPDTIAGVLTQKSQYGRFHWTGVVWPSRAAHEPEAVERAYRCAEAVLTEPRLLPEDVVFQAEFVQGEIVASAPGYYFCR